MIAYENTVKQFLRDMRAKRLVKFLCAEYESATGSRVSGELRYGWKYALGIIFFGLMGAGKGVNPDSGIRIDLEESTRATHMKLIFASSSEGTCRYSILGLYAGSSVKFTAADDIVSFREGNTRWTTIHPSMLMSNYSRRLFGGIPETEAQGVNYESAAFLFDCFFSCDTDILSDYNDQLTDAFPIFYANDMEELQRYLDPVLGCGGGADALRKLDAIEKLSASQAPGARNEDQIYLVSSIINNVRRRRKAWYVIEGQTGTGKGTIIRDAAEKLTGEGKTVRFLKGGETAEDSPDLVVIDQENGGTLEQLEYDGVSVFLCDDLREADFESFETDARLTALAEEGGAQLYISHLKQNISFADGGRGMRWLVNRLQLADIQREDYDPELYDIELADSEEELAAGSGRGLAAVLLPPNIVYEKDSGRIRMKKTQKKGIYNALSTGRKGALIFCNDKELRNYLEDEISALRIRQKWVRGFVTHMAEGKAAGSGEMDALADQSTAAAEKQNAAYREKIRASLGENAWKKMDEKSKMWIASALMAYDSLKAYDRMVDFSGVCVQIGKASEYELKRRIYTGFIEYQRKVYGEEHFHEKLPSECFVKTDTRKPAPAKRKLLNEDQITLGKLRYIIGIDDTGKVVNQPIWKEFSAFAKNALFVNADNPLRSMQAQLPVINKIKDEYRNRSAHSQAISIVDARECIEYVVTDSRKLGKLLDEYRF